jgi:hypothetical protein
MANIGVFGMILVGIGMLLAAVAVVALLVWTALFLLRRLNSY